MTDQTVKPCEFAEGHCIHCGDSEPTCAMAECEGWVEPADRVQTLADQVEALTKERDTLQYEVDAIPAIKAERDALQTALKNTLSSMGQQADELRKERDTQAKAADHWIAEATRDHNALVTLRVERDALMADAERYRWISAQIVSGDMDTLEQAFATLDEDAEFVTQSEFDACIDSAIEKAGVK